MGFLGFKHQHLGLRRGIGALNASTPPAQAADGRESRESKGEECNGCLRD